MMYFVTRQHINPDNEEHAALCAVTSPLIQGEWLDAKNAMANLVVENEKPEHALPFLRGLVACTGPVNTVNAATGTSWTGSTWTVGEVRWTIRQVS